MPNDDGKPAEEMGTEIPTSRLEVGSRISSVINDIGVAQAAVATDLSVRTLQRYGTGQTEPPLSVLVQLARMGGVTLDWIATGEGPKSLGEVHAAHALHEANAPVQAQADGGIDDFLLVDTVVEVEDLLDLEGLSGMESLKKAQLFLTVYKRRLESRQSGERFTSADIVRLVRGK